MDNMDKKLGKEKQEAYSIEYTHFKKALKEEFYLEAVAIGYAIIEDRFNAFFHYAGIHKHRLDKAKQQTKVP